MDASEGINAQDAGLFSQDAYDAPGTVEPDLGVGWTEDVADEEVNGVWMDQTTDPTDDTQPLHPAKGFSANCHDTKLGQGRGRVE